MLLKTRNYKNKPKTDIYKEIGFKDNVSFIKAFLKITGNTPYVYRKECYSNPSYTPKNKMIPNINENALKRPFEPRIADILAKSIII